ncbi:MAG: ABC transporter permease subunit [Anaerolineales bacterium]|nr:ABC transporter permease subunit [Anaerolineales bacterium]
MPLILALLWQAPFKSRQSFSWPGLGSAIFEAVGRRDFPVLQGAFLLIAVAVIFANLLADLTYNYLDPRVNGVANGEHNTGPNHKTNGCSFLEFWQTFSKTVSALSALACLPVIIFLAIFAPWIAPYDSSSSAVFQVGDIYNPPSASHWFGTDDAGQDVFSNFIFGARISLIVGFFAAFISIIIGGVLGLVAGFFGGRWENFIMRFTDIFLVIPDLPLMVVIVALTKPSLLNIIFVIGLLGWTTTARVVRSQTLAVKSRKFVLRARAVGAGNGHIISRHILPLVMPILVVQAVLVVSLAILNESALSFIGLGDPTTLSWGQMLNYAFGRGPCPLGMVGVVLPRDRHCMGGVGVDPARAGA